MFEFSETRAVTAVAAGATAYAVLKFGVLSRIPSVGPLSAPLATIILGAILATSIKASGLTGEAAHGVGYGLIVAGVLTSGA